MAEPKKINPLLKQVLELGPVIAFFAAYVLVKDRTFMWGDTEYRGFIAVTAGFVPLMMICMAILWKLTGHLSKMQVLTLVLVVVFGGLTVWLNDDRFFKMKPTILYLFFGGALGVGLLRGQSYLQTMMDAVLPLTDTGWMILTRRMAALFLILAVLNELIWRTQSEETWVYFKTFGLTAAVFGFFIFQGRLFSEHGTEEEEEAD